MNTNIYFSYCLVYLSETAYGRKDGFQLMALNGRVHHSGGSRAEWQRDFCRRTTTWWLEHLAGLLHMTQTKGQTVQPEPEAGETFKCLPLETCFYPLGPHHKGSVSFQSSAMD